MKKLLLVGLTFFVYACNSVDAPVNPYPEIDTIQDLPEEHRFKPKQCSLTFQKEGELDQISSSGRRIKAKIKNHCIDEEVFIYHPNGKLHSNTPLIDGLAHGWSNGYSIDGKLQTRILYQQGKTTRIQIYDRNGQMIKEIN